MNDKAKSKYLIRTLELFLALLLFRIIEYFVIKTDRSFLAENFIHKVIGIIILLLVLRKTKESLSDIGFTRRFQNLFKGLLMGGLFFFISYCIEIIIQLSKNNNPKLMIYTAGFPWMEK